MGNSNNYLIFLASIDTEESADAQSAPTDCGSCYFVKNDLWLAARAVLA
jgi:hypothetical protein